MSLSAGLALPLALLWPRPALHVHVSGSGGTSFCRMARKQPTPRGQLKDGHAFACFLPCKGNLDFRREFTSLDSTGQYGSRCSTFNDSMYASCAALESTLRARGYNVVGMSETFLSEIGSTQPRPLRCGRNKCCICNGASLGDRLACDRSRRRTGRLNLLQVARGAASPFDERWPLSGWRPFSTYCPNVAFTILIHDPVRRIVSLLEKKCASLGCLGDAAPACAERLLADVVEHDLVVDLNDGQAMMGTAAINEYNIRMLLGPRTFFARLGAINETHYRAAAAMIDRFAVAAPTAMLSQLGPELSRKLNWKQYSSVPHVNSHQNRTSARAAVAGRARGRTARGSQPVRSSAPRQGGARVVGERWFNRLHACWKAASEGGVSDAAERRAEPPSGPAATAQRDRAHRSHHARSMRDQGLIKFRCRVRACTIPGVVVVLAAARRRSIVELLSVCASLRRGACRARENGNRLAASERLFLSRCGQCELRAAEPPRPRRMCADAPAHHSMEGHQRCCSPSPRCARTRSAPRTWLATRHNRHCSQTARCGQPRTLPRAARRWRSRRS